jgi:hypothetical protein
MPEPKPVPVVPSVTVTTNLGGTVVVTTDALLTQLDSLTTLAGQLRRCASDLVEVLQRREPRYSIAYDLPPAALEARRLSSAAERVLLSTGSWSNTHEPTRSLSASAARWMNL